MATTRKRSVKAELEAAAPEAAPVLEPEQPQELNAVLLIRQENGDDLSVQVQTLGNVRVTEIETILKLGLKELSSRIGV